MFLYKVIQSDSSVKHGFNLFPKCLISMITFFYWSVILFINSWSQKLQNSAFSSGKHFTLLQPLPKLHNYVFFLLQTIQVNAASAFQNILTAGETFSCLDFLAASWDLWRLGAVTLSRWTTRPRLGMSLTDSFLSCALYLAKSVMESSSYWEMYLNKVVRNWMNLMKVNTYLVMWLVAGVTNWPSKIRINVWSTNFATKELILGK